MRADSTVGHRVNIPSSSGAADRIRSSTGPLVFLLPGLGADDPLLDHFREPLEKELDLVQLDYFDWTQLIQPGVDFHTLIANLVQQIVAIAPQGGIRLAGYSMGGHLAYATARALEAAGREVACLAVLDAPAELGGMVARPLSARLRARVEKISSVDVRAGPASVVAKALTRPQAVASLRRLTHFRQRPLPLDFHRYLHRKLTMQLLLRGFLPWWPTFARPAKPLVCPAYLFRSREHEAYVRNDLGWGDYCSNLTVISVNATHNGMLDPKQNAKLRATFVEIMNDPAASASAASR